MKLLERWLEPAGFSRSAGPGVSTPYTAQMSTRCVQRVPGMLLRANEEYGISGFTSWSVPPLTEALCRPLPPLLPLTAAVGKTFRACDDKKTSKTVRHSLELFLKTLK